MALLRTDMAQEDWLTQYVPLRVNMRTFNGSDLTEHPVNNIVHAVENLVSTRTVVIYGDEGTGKSSSLNHLTSVWKNRSGLVEKFSHVYLLPIRQINSPTSQLEHIICHDLKLVPPAQEQAIRRFIKFNAPAILWLLDGYDERIEQGMEQFTINKLISGEYAPKSKVIVTSRPHANEHLSNLVTENRSEIFLKGFDDRGVKQYLQGLPREWAPTFKDLVGHSGIPRELLRSPLILAMICYIHKMENKRSSDGNKSSKQLVTICAVLDTVVGILIGMMEEKREKRQLPRYISYRDLRLSDKIKGIIKSMTKVAFDSTKRSEYEIDVEELNEQGAYKEDIENIGILHFDKSKYSFLHPLFQEHAAAHHLAIHDDDLQQVLHLSKKSGLMTTKLGALSNTLLFTVGIRARVLSLIGDADQHLSTVTVTGMYQGCSNLDLELSYQSRLFHECSDSATKKEFLDKLAQYPLSTDPVLLSHQPQIEAASYINLIDALGLDGCLHLLNKVHGHHLRVDIDKTFLSAPPTTRTRYITDSILLSCLPAIHLTNTDRLVIQFASLKVLEHTATKWKVIMSRHLCHAY